MKYLYTEIILNIANKMITGSQKQVNLLYYRVQKALYTAFHATYFS